MSENAQTHLDEIRHRLLSVLVTVDHRQAQVLRRHYGMDPETAGDDPGDADLRRIAARLVAIKKTKKS